MIFEVRKVLEIQLQQQQQQSKELHLQALRESMTISTVWMFTTS